MGWPDPSAGKTQTWEEGRARCRPPWGPYMQAYARPCEPGLRPQDPFPRQASTRHRAPRALGDTGSSVFLSTSHELPAHLTCSVHSVYSCLGGSIAA